MIRNSKATSATDSEPFSHRCIKKFVEHKTTIILTNALQLQPPDTHQYNAVGLAAVEDHADHVYL
jgi:hypothetical protein